MKEFVFFNSYLLKVLNNEFELQYTETYSLHQEESPHLGKHLYIIQHFQQLKL